MSDIAIIGTGQIGTSIALRLHEGETTSQYRIVGVETHRDHAIAARRTGAFVDVSPDPVRAVADAGLVIIATPTRAISQVLRDLAGDFAVGSTITDTGSAKADVHRTAVEVLPEGVFFIGGHPMAGTTGTGPDSANPKLFEDARWVMTPDHRAPENSINLVLGLIAQMGAKAMWMDAAEHDAYVAAISHLPMLSSTALFHLARDSEAWPELSVLAATGFRSATRLAGTDEQMAHDIAVTNREQLSHWLDRYVGELDRLRALLADPGRDEELFTYLAEASLKYGAFESGAVGRVEVDQVEMPDLSMFDMLMGGALAQRAREMTKEAEPAEGTRRRGH